MNNINGLQNRFCVNLLNQNCRPRENKLERLLDSNGYSVNLVGKVPSEASWEGQSAFSGTRNAPFFRHARHRLHRPIPWPRRETRQT